MLAFFLPLVIWAMVINQRFLPGWIQPAVIDLFIASCLYHGYYRAKTLAADLGAAGKDLAVWRFVFMTGLLLGLLMLAGLNIFLFLF